MCDKCRLGQVAGNIEEGKSKVFYLLGVGNDFLKSLVFEVLLHGLGLLSLVLNADSRARASRSNRDNRRRRLRRRGGCRGFLKHRIAGGAHHNGTAAPRPKCCNRLECSICKSNWGPCK